MGQLTSELANVEELLKKNQAMLENLEVGSFQFFMNDTSSQESDNQEVENENDRIKELFESFLSDQEIANEIAKEIQKPDEPLTPLLKSQKSYATTPARPMKESAAKSVLMTKMKGSRGSQFPKTTSSMNKKNSTKSDSTGTKQDNSAGKNTPFLNIDGINFGSDDYYNEFYDGEFDLVDDAVISYQEEGNEWFDDANGAGKSNGFGDSSGFLNSDGFDNNEGIIIHDGGKGQFGLKVEQPSSTTPSPLPGVISLFLFSVL